MTDPDGRQTFSYVVLSGNAVPGGQTAADYFGVNPSSGHLSALRVVPGVLNYSSFSLSVQVTDSGSAGQQGCLRSHRSKEACGRARVPGRGVRDAAGE